MERDPVWWAESAYQLAFTQGGAIAGTVSNLPDGTVVALSSEQEQLPGHGRCGGLCL